MNFSKKLLALLYGVASAHAACAQTGDFKISDDFTIERIAVSPQVERPMMATFDDRGRLFVCDSSGVNLHGPELLKNPPHFIRLLEDTTGTGLFDKSTVFADHMVFPQGIAWHDGSVYVSSPPNFWRLQDTNGDGVADQREILATGFALTGVSDDMHGGTLGPDGRIYWFAGRFPHEIKRPNGPIIHAGTAPLMLRCKPDGSELEVVCGAQGNGVGVAFTPEGEGFASGTFLAPDSMGAGLRDAIIHCVEGGNYPIRDRVLDELKRTGDLLPPLTHLGVAAAADITIYRGTNFGANYEGNLFSALFNMHKIVRHVIERDGATFKCRNEDFLVSTNTDFHPTDVFEDADGSLLVVDTGGWFRIGCPTSQLAKPDVKGAIYRIRRKGAPRVSDPRGLQIAWDKISPDELAMLLGDARFAVQDHAVEKLASRGEESLAALKNTITGSASLEARRNAVWALARMDGVAAREVVRLALSDKEASVRQVAANVAGLWRDISASAKLMELVGTDTLPIRREAATALGRIGRNEAVPALLNSLRAGADRFLEHALIFALIRINDPTNTLKALSDTNAAVRRGALIALDQMDNTKLRPAQVTPFLDPSDPAMQQTALWVIGHHLDWGSAMLDYFRDALAHDIIDEKQHDNLKQQLAAFSRDPQIQKLITDKLHAPETSAAIRLLLLEAIAQSPLDILPPALGAELKSSLQSSDEHIVRQTVGTIRSLPAEKRPAIRRVDEQINFEPTLKRFAGTRFRDNFFVRWSGLIKIPSDGNYTFSLDSDDGSRLFIEGQQVIDNGGQHGMREKSGEMKLKSGLHPMHVDFFQARNEAGCKLSWQSDEIPKVIIPAANLAHRKNKNEIEGGLNGEYFDMAGEWPGFLVPRLSFDEALTEVANNPSNSTAVRLDAISVLAPQLTPLPGDLFQVPLGVLASEKSPLVRMSAAEAFSRAHLSQKQLLQLSQVFTNTGAVEMSRLLSVYEHDEDAAVGRSLIHALENSPGLKSVRADALRKTLAKYPQEVQDAAQPIFQKLATDLAKQKARLAELEPVLKGGDVQRGREVFFGNKVACFTCHTVQERGGHVGPNLSKIGAIRNGHDLLEAIAFPSASFARGFEPFFVTTDDGETYSGVIGRETADAIYLTSGPRAETRLPRNHIQEIKPGAVSIMPEGLDAQLSKQDFSDLIAFLVSLR